VTEGDLIRRLAEEKRGPLGWFLGLFGDSRRLAERFAKAHGARAQDVMTRDLVTVGGRLRLLPRPAGHRSSGHRDLSRGA
jgi:hypothetical protein